jgi:hypothetical protein
MYRAPIAGPMARIVIAHCQPLLPATIGSS